MNARHEYDLNVRTDMNYGFEGDESVFENSSLPGLVSFGEFVDAGCEVRRRIKARAGDEITKIILNGYRPKRLPVYPVGKEPFPEQKAASKAALKEIEKTASTQQDFVDICFYFAWNLIADRYYSFPLYYEDIHHEMMLAVCEHTKEYLEKGKGRWKPLTFFGRWMIHAACDFISSEICKTNPYYASAEKKINSWCRENHTEPEEITEQELAAGCGISLKTVMVVMDIKRAKRFVYLDNGADYENIFYMSGEQYWDEVVKGIDMWNLRGMTDEILKKRLTPFEYLCVTEYYGLCGMVPLKITAIARKYGTSFAKIKNTLMRAKEHLAEDPDLKKGAWGYVDGN